MATGIFKGPKGALMFMGMTLGSVVLLVGTEEDEGALVMAADELGRETADSGSRDASRLPVPPPPRPIRRPESTEDDSAFFAEEEELLDDTSGFDPSPEPIVPFDNPAADSGATIVESYGEIEQF
ncbi:hypothetical protein [Altererythrobacter sp. GH1-8]|uniref:hypothetical protein n=1 Tax=Altererythrobacter sp. GH1-8 TaxID=3349333 RepID=UPI00374D9E49